MGLFRIFLYLVCISGVSLFAEVIDQIAASVDNDVITQSQIVAQIRVAAFLNGVPPDFSAQNRRKTADRIIEQLLVKHEMDATRYPTPTLPEIQDTLKQVQSRFPNEEEFRRALAQAHIAKEQLEQSLIDQTALVRFIDLRFRPEVQVEETDVQRYCENVYLPELKKKGVQPEPTLDQAMPQCEHDFTASLVDARIEAWLKETRGRARITYDEDAFQ